MVGRVPGGKQRSWTPCGSCRSPRSTARAEARVAAKSVCAGCWVGQTDQRTVAAKCPHAGHVAAGCNRRSTEQLAMAACLAVTCSSKGSRPKPRSAGRQVSKACGTPGATWRATRAAMPHNCGERPSNSAWYMRHAELLMKPRLDAGNMHAGPRQPLRQVDAGLHDFKSSVMP